jgi:lauroyl/myristoyl acyltransferase
MINYLLYKLGEFVALAVPLKIGYKIAAFFSDLHYFFAKVDRAEVTSNLKTIFPEKTDKEIARIRITIFRNFAKYLVDFFRYPLVNKDYIDKNVRVANQHYFDEALARGKGVVVLTAHIGNWELGGVTIGLLGYPFWVVALAHKNKKIDEFFNKRRESMKMKVIPFAKAVRQCFKVLKENQMVALVGDKDYTKEGGVIVDFFGKPTSLPQGPAAFALMTGAVILPGFMLREPDDSFTLYMEKPIEPAQGKDYKNENDLKEMVDRYKVIMEDYIRKYPDQWYMFREFRVKNDKK